MSTGAQNPGNPPPPPDPPSNTPHYMTPCASPSRVNPTHLSALLNNIATLQPTSADGTPQTGSPRNQSPVRQSPRTPFVRTSPANPQPQAGTFASSTATGTTPTGPSASDLQRSLFKLNNTRGETPSIHPPYSQEPMTRLTTPDREPPAN